MPPGLKPGSTARMHTLPSHPPKYRQVYDALLRQILSGRIEEGGRLPSEAELVARFGASRITVARALRELQLAGLIDRRAGSGSFVRPRRAATRALTFGVLIPDFGRVEVFDAICRGFMDAPITPPHALVWGSTAGTLGRRDLQLRQLCQQYIARRVDGVFFAPIEHVPESVAMNRAIAEAFEAARIPFVLVDRSIEPYPQRSRHDLIGLDNRRAGAVVTTHLVELGCRRLAFLGLPDAASSVDARAAGFRDALLQAGLMAAPAQFWRESPDDVASVWTRFDAERPDAIVCATDRTAAGLMHTLLGKGIRIPDDVRLVGIDDVSCAGVLPVPLTTLRQPSRDIGVAAVAALAERVSNPDLPPRDILLHGSLVVRQSCGAAL
jgi:GntR family transcriptional regulator, arabinose operon transcriptional repressor